MALWFLAMIAHNVVHVFYRRALKPQLRDHVTLLHGVRLILAELYAADSMIRVPAPS